jgi:hypothetical protein
VSRGCSGQRWWGREKQRGVQLKCFAEQLFEMTVRVGVDQRKAEQGLDGLQKPSELAVAIGRPKPPLHAGRSSHRIHNRRTSNHVISEPGTGNKVLLLCLTWMVVVSLMSAPFRGPS